MASKRTTTPRGMKGSLRYKGRKQFTGREEEKNTFEKAILTIGLGDEADEETNNVFNIYGEGGSGKSLLIREYEAICRGHNIKYVTIDAHPDNGQVISDLIDLLRIIRSHFSQTRFQKIMRSYPFQDFDDAYRKYKGLQSKVEERRNEQTSPSATSRIIGSLAAEAIKQVPGGNVVGALVEPTLLQEGSREIIIGAAQSMREWLVAALGNTDDADFFQEADSLLVEAFCTGMHNTFDDEVFVLMLDTYEELEHIDRAIREDFLAEVESNIVIVLSGRHSLRKRFDHSWVASTEFFEMKPFTLQEVEVYLSKRVINQPNLAEHIRHFTHGWPLAVSLLIDIVVQLPKQVDVMMLFDDNEAGVTGTSSKEVTERVAARFLSQVTEDEQAIIWSMFVVNSFDRKTLQAMNTELTFTNAQLNHLLSFSFVMPIEDRFVIHSIVRDYVLRDLHQRRNAEYVALHQRAAEMYQRNRSELESKYTDYMLRDAWQVATSEMYYHNLQAEPQAGIVALLVAVAEELNERNIEFATKLLRVASRPVKTRVETIALLEEVCQLVKDNAEERAIKRLESQLQQPHLPPIEQYVLAIAIGRLLMDWPSLQYEQALRYFDTALKAIDDGTPNQGYIFALLRKAECYEHRQQWQKARECAEQALSLADTLQLTEHSVRCRIQLARIARSQGKLIEAHQFLESLLAEKQQLPEQIQQEVLKDQAQVFQLQGEHSKAIAILRRIVTRLTSSGYSERLAKAWQTLGQAYQSKSDYTEALRCFQEGQHVAEEIGHHNLVANISVDRAKALIANDHIREGIDVLTHSRQAYDELQQDAAVASIWDMIGDAYRAWHKYKAAVEHYERARELYIRFEQKLQLAGLDSGIAYTYRLQHDYKQAIHYYTQALKQYEALELWLDVAHKWNSLAITYREWGNFDEAIRYYQEAQKRYERLERPDHVADNFLSLGRLEWERGNYAKAVEWLTQSREQYHQIGHVMSEALLWWWLGDTYRVWEHFPAAEQHYQEARTRYERLERADQVAGVLFGLGLLERARGQYQASIDWLTQSRDRYQQQGRALDEANLWNHMGDTYRVWEHFPEAEQHYQEARTRYERLERADQVAGVLFGLGLLERARGQYQASIDWLTQSRDRYQQQGRALDEANLWNHMGDTYRVWEHFPEAEQHYQEARTRYERLERADQVADILLGLGLLERACGQHQASIDWLTQSRDQYQQLGRKADEANLWNHMGDTYRLWGQFEKAEQHYQEARTRYERLERADQVADIFLGLGLLERERGNYAKAVEWLTQSRDRYQQLGRPLDEANLWNHMGTTYRLWGQFEKAEQHYQEARTRYERLERADQVAGVLFGLGLLERAREQYQPAIDWLTQSRDRSQQLGRPLDEANLWNQLAITGLLQNLADRFPTP